MVLGLGCGLPSAPKIGNLKFVNNEKGHLYFIFPIGIDLIMLKILIVFVIKIKLIGFHICIHIVSVIIIK